MVIYTDFKKFKHIYCKTISEFKQLFTVNDLIYCIEKLNKDREKLNLSTYIIEDKTIQNCYNQICFTILYCLDTTKGYTYMNLDISEHINHYIKLEENYE